MEQGWRGGQIYYRRFYERQTKQSINLALAGEMLTRKSNAQESLSLFA